jgi:hypothetical protein
MACKMLNRLRDTLSYKHCFQDGVYKCVESLVAQAEKSKNHRLIKRNNPNTQILTISKFVDLCENYACFLLVGL